MGGDDATSDDEAGTGTDGGAVVGPPLEGRDGCTDAPLVDDGRWRVDLRGYSTAGTVACGSLSADGYFRYRVKRRGDVKVRVQGERFRPVLSVIAGGCPGGSQLACSLQTSALTDDPNAAIVEVADLRAGTELLLAVGIETDVADTLAEGPLEVELVTSSSPVWVAGERCGELGRCASGGRRANPRCPGRAMWLGPSGGWRRGL